MDILSFVNPGEIDPRSFTTFGLNAKPNSTNPIGFFGTGLKYAIAIVNRLGGEIVIWSGKKPFYIERVDGEFRGKDIVELVYRTSKDKRKKATALPFTTELGKSWEPWMAFRELYCNARDEKGDCVAKRLEPEAGTTLIEVIGVPQLVEAFEKRTAFMLDPSMKPVLSSFGLEVYKGRSNGIYYRGILVGQTEKDHDYTYNVTSPVDLTEDRTMKHQWMFPGMVANFWLQKGADVEPHLRSVVAGDRDSFEASLPWSSSGFDPSDGFLEVVDKLRREGAPVHDRIRELHDKFKANAGDPEQVELTPAETAMLERARHVLREVFGYEITQPVIPCRSLGPSTFGLAHKGRIFISKRAFEAGQVWVTGTLLEEFGHVALAWKDESRDMQNSLLNMLAGLAERYVNEAKQ